jgi:N utilization substance protein B
MTRRKSREDALRILFSWDTLDSNIDIVIDACKKSFKIKEISSFTKELVNGVIKNIKEIDELIVKFAKDWSLYRIFTIDKNILRIAIYELSYCNDIPKITSINEAIELAKKYSSRDASVFINGILDAILKDLEKKV